MYEMTAVLCVLLAAVLAVCMVLLILLKRLTEYAGCILRFVSLRESASAEGPPEKPEEEAEEAARRRMDEGVASILSYEPKVPEVELP